MTQMDFQLFSQIPNAVLNRVQPARLKPRKKKSVKFQDEALITSSDQDFAQTDKTRDAGLKLKHEPGLDFSLKSALIVQDTEVLPILDTQKIIKQNDGEVEDSQEVRSSEKRKTSDAIVQVDGPVLVSKSSQTDDDLYEQYKNQLQANAIVGYKPMHSFPKQKGSQPPLRLGLTVPKGKKRKVFYPDEQDL